MELKSALRHLDGRVHLKVRGSCVVAVARRRRARTGEGSPLAPTRGRAWSVARSAEARPRFRLRSLRLLVLISTCIPRRRSSPTLLPQPPHDTRPRVIFICSRLRSNVEQHAAPRSHHRHRLPARPPPSCGAHCPHHSSDTCAISTVRSPSSQSAIDGPTRSPCSLRRPSVLPAAHAPRSWQGLVPTSYRYRPP